MKIQVNSDKTIAVDAGLTRFVEGEVSRILDRFARRLTRVEVHLSDVDGGKTGQADKRCLIEVRPMGTQPLSASSKAPKLSSAVDEALGKMQRSLTTFFGRRGRPAAAVSARGSRAKKKTVTSKATPGTNKKAVMKKAAVKKAAVKKRVKLSPGGPKKKRIYQARRKAWPAR
jgi:ribosome-associated translation inhibitor RaiA